MQKDRDYYRMCSNADLIEEAKYNINTELALVLSERLSKEEQQADRDDQAWTKEISDLEDTVDRLEDDNNDLRDQIEDMEREITELEAALAAEKLRSVEDRQDKLTDLASLGDNMFEMRRRINELEAQLEKARSET